MAKSRRREYGEGSIYQLNDGRWAASLRLETGKRKYFYSRKSRADVKAKLERFKRDQEAGIVATQANKQTVRQYLEYWLQVKKATVEARTIIRYREYVENVCEHIGHMKLIKLTVDQVQECYGKLQETLAPNTIRQLHTILSSAFKDAIEWKRLAINPCKGARRPKEEKPEITALTAEQASALMEQAKGTGLECMIAVAVTTGMRRGELFGLKWADVNLERKTMQVKRSATYVVDENGSRFIEKDPKTKSSKRQIALPQFVVDALKAHRTRQTKQRLAASSWEDNGLVFTNRKGGHYYERTLYRQFAPLLERAGLPEIRFHDLRHSAATILLVQGVHPKVVQELLGHSNIQITMNVYSHVIPTMQADAMDRISVLYSSLEQKTEHF